MEIEYYIEKHLTGSTKQVALDFIGFLRDNEVAFIKDEGYWRSKIYYYLKYKGINIAFIAIKDPDEPENLWTVWSDDSSIYEADISCDSIKQAAWTHVDFCGGCGSCGGGKQKKIFGKAFDRVCGCTFRIDNPNEHDLPFLKRMIEIRKAEIQKS